MTFTFFLKTLRLVLSTFIVIASFPHLAFAQEVPTTPTLRILFIGDSLTEGYGVARADSYPALLEKKFQSANYKNLVFINASISGSTTASALSRLKWQLKTKPQILLIALGANDGLRGLKVSETEKNLSDTLNLATKEGINSLLLGMKVPPNYGKTFATDFENIFSRLSKKHKISFVPFLLEGVGGESEMNQSDGIHPNEKGHQKMAELVFPYLQKQVDLELERTKAKK